MSTGGSRGGILIPPRSHASGAEARIYSGRPQAIQQRLQTKLNVNGGFRGGILIPRAFKPVELKPGFTPGVPQAIP